MFWENANHAYQFGLYTSAINAEAELKIFEDFRSATVASFNTFCHHAPK